MTETPAVLLDLDAPVTGDLARLADAYRVSTQFFDWRGEPVVVRARTVVRVLAALDVPVASEADVAAALELVAVAPWRRLLPDVVVTLESGKGDVTVHVPEESLSELSVWLEPELGGRVWLEPGTVEDSRELDGVIVVRVPFTPPDDLPLGWHRLSARIGSGEVVSRPYVVTPRRLELPAETADSPAWGFMTQLYSVRSRLSWGLGDLGDLADLAVWSARRHSADFVLLNPLHAAAPLAPMEPSPYLPTTRRFVNPIYLRVEDIREVAYMPSTDRAIVEWQAEAMRVLNTDPGRLDRDEVWAAKRAALEAVFEQPRSLARQLEFQAFQEQEGQGLADFATWCALAERFGLPTTHWPVEALDPQSIGLAGLRAELAGRIQFHSWLQWCLDQQLAETARRAAGAGMRVGIVHDLAVGVHPDGADAWALRASLPGGVLARGVTGGAPPDAFNQQGQDWSQPPWRPDQLTAHGYEPFRDMLRTVLRHAGALRVDHIIGLFRLWWIPKGQHASEGTYVYYDHEALLGILALEAHRAGAFVIGEDLGNVEPSTREYLAERGVLGTSVLWFEKDDQGRPKPPENWRELCLATVTTHDLPPTAGYLAGEHIDLRDRLGLLTRAVDEERRVDEADRAAVGDQLRELGLLHAGTGSGDPPTEREQVEALHRFLTLTPSRLIGVALADAVGDRRAMNQPGTSDEYPNWRLPLADGTGRPMLLEEVMASARVRDLAAAVRVLPAED